MISIDTKELKKRYLLANNAEQVYEWFRTDGALRDLARGEYKEALMQEYKRITERSERTIDDAVVAYAILIIITFYEYREGMEVYSNLNLKKLKWGEELVGIYERAERITLYKTERGKGIISDFGYTKSDASNNAS